MWIFDMADGGARLLRQRSGHSEPPTKLRFHGNDGQVLLSAGKRSGVFDDFSLKLVKNMIATAKCTREVEN